MCVSNSVWGVGSNVEEGFFDPLRTTGATKPRWRASQVNVSRIQTQKERSLEVKSTAEALPFMPVCLLSSAAPA